MPLGLLARDSIQDLATIGREHSSTTEAPAKATSSSCDQKDSSGEIDSSPTSAATPPPAASATTTTATDSSSPNTPKDSGDSTTKVNSNENQSQSSKENGSTISSHSSSYGQYTGFRSDFYNENYYYHDSYAPIYEGKGPNVGFWQGLLPCLFPWTFRQGRLEEDDGGHEADTDAAGVPVIQAASKDEDEVSNGSAKMGEKLSDKERMAVLNRLRLGQPDSLHSEQTSSDASVESKKKGLLKGLSSYQPTEGGKIKGILKNTVTLPPPPPPKTKKSTISQEGAQRRALFPQYSGVGSFHGNAKGVNVAFAPMARVMTVKSRNDMTQPEKGDIWWQKDDYEDFRKTGRIITRAMAEGGSEIWLDSQTKQKVTPSESKDDPADVISATGDKWWHKFGHSRRGLEHVVSIDEGRQRQLNVKRAISAVLEEQIRQRRGRKQDPERLRHVSMQHTSWARDLALASGASDADAVKSQFAEDRKSREFYLLKIARNSPLQVDRHVPDFMQPAIQAMSPQRLVKKSVPSPHVLDANTAAQIRFRRKSLLKEESKEESCEPVHDADEDDDDDDGSKESMAQRAAGFSADGDKKVNMAAVLSGMGAVPQNAQVLSTA
jgi:hypothetical protein